jgi:hypothetical protein
MTGRPFSLVFYYYRKVVQEYEKTISEIIGDRERERVCMEIEKEKVARDRDQTLDDLHSAERAFNDVHRYVNPKYFGFLEIKYFAFF